MLETVCMHIHNYFDTAGTRGAHVISGGALRTAALSEGEYYRVIGSRLNDGVHRHPADDLADEAFVGEVRPMRPPRAFLALVAEIAAWRERYAASAEGPFQSESVMGVYSYRKGGAAWQQAFADRLNAWRKLS